MPELLLDRLDQARPTCTPTDPPARPPAIDFRRVTAKAPDGTTLLDDVSFRVQAGTTVAIVGPTGAGKTSLARALTGSLRVETGSIILNGHKLGDELARHRVAYVPQDDTLHGGLSLRRALEHTAALRLPDLSARERSARVTEVLVELGLDARTNTQIRSLSVGQRKRASVASQLLGDPDLVVLDEPTSGLDPGYERVVMRLLADLAASGRTIVLVTHSVEALRACDQVVFLAAGGTVAYTGPPASARQYFETANAADLFLALDTEPGETWIPPVDLDEPDSRKADAAPLGSVPEPRRLGQLRVLVRRQLDLMRADRRHSALLALQGPVIGALLWAVLPSDGLLVRHNQPGGHAMVVVMFLVLSTTWLGVTNAIREVVKERSIVRLEVRAGLSPSAYVTSKLVALGGITMLQSAVLAFVATTRQHAPADGLWLPARLELVLVAAVVGLTACALGLALSSAASSADKALALLPATLVLQLTFAGVWAADSHMALIREVRALMGARWGMEAMAAILRADLRQLAAAGAAFAALTLGAVAVAVVCVSRATRSKAPRTRAPLGRVTALGAGSIVAVAVTIGGGGAAVMAIALPHETPSSAAAAAPASAQEPTSHAASPATTTPPEPAPTVAPPVAQAPVTHAATTHRAPTASASPTPTTPVSVPTHPTPEVAPTTTTPPTSPTTTVPVAPTSAQTPLQQWMSRFSGTQGTRSGR